MSIPTNRSQFKSYCLRSLGAGVIEINVSVEQIDDRIDEALTLYQEYHMDATENKYIPYEVTADDLTNGYFTIPEPVLTVVKVLNVSSSTSGDQMNPLWNMKNDIYSILGFSSTTQCNPLALSRYLSSMTNLANMESLMMQPPRTIYFPHSNRLYIEGSLEDIAIGDFLMLYVYSAIDPSTNPDIWSDNWLLKYATALLGKQWGNNLKKFQQMELPGGITLNGSEIYQDYDLQVKDLVEELIDQWVLPPSFITG